MKIDFETLKFKNVLSFGNKITSFNFRNGIDLVIGSNGLGKSTFVDALTYGLFGKPFRKIKIGSLINNKNNKQSWVEVVFLIGENRFKIIRGQKPEIFEIYKENKNNSEFELVEKPSTNKDYQNILENNILQFGENVYRQLIALGANLSSSKNFMDLSKSEKEEVLQVITDTAIFNQIKEKVKEQKLVQKTNLTEYEYRVSLLSTSIQSTKNNISAMENQNSEFISNKDKILADLKKEKDEILEKLENYPKAFLILDSIHIEWLENAPIMKELESKLENITEKEHDTRAKSRTLISNEQNKIICPSCNFEIKEKLPYSKSELKEELLLIQTKKNVLNSEISNLKDSQDNKFQKVKNRKRLEQNKQQLEIQLENVELRISNTESWKSVDIDYCELEKMENDFILVKEKLISIKGEMSDLIDLEEIVSDKFLKGVILNQQLPFLNKYINEFLELFESKFNFVIDSEFNEKIISRHQDNDFNSLSNGQKQRISLSILFAFLKLIEEKNGISTNLLILDEYLDSSLDQEGIEEVMNILDSVFSSKKDVVLISHNTDIKNKLELLNRTIEVYSEDGFSSFLITEF